MVEQIIAEREKKKSSEKKMKTDQKVFYPKFIRIEII